MHKLSKFRYLSILTLIFFVWSSVIPAQVWAHHPGNWHDGGQGFGGDTNPGNSPENTKPPDPAKNGAGCGGDPVYLHSGEYFYNCTDLVIPGRGSTGLTTSGMDVEIQHRYNSGSTFNNQFGYGWVINYYYRLKPLDNNNVLIVSGEGRNDEYTYAGGGSYTAPPGFFEMLVKNGNGTWTLTQAHGDKLHFDIDGNLSAKEDRNGNRISFTYNPAGLLPVIGVSPYTQNPEERVVIGYDYRLIQITDTVGRAISFTYNPDGRLDKITDYAGREVKFAYDPITDDLLSRTKPVTAQYPSGVTESYSYEAHRMLTMTDAKGQSFMTNHYTAEGKVDTQVYGEGTFSFDYTGLPTTVTQTDRKGFVTTYTLNDKGNVLQEKKITQGLRPDDPADFTTVYTYNTDMMRTSVTFHKGNGIKYVYDEGNANRRSRGNLLQIRRKTSMAAPDNDTNDIVIRVTYENRFNFPKTITDPKGNVYTYTYDYELSPSDPRYGEKGNLVTISYPPIPAGIPEVNFTYNAYGQVIEVQDPNGNITEYSYYPATGYLEKIIQDASGINAITQVTWDTYGNVDLVTDSNNHATDYDFDALGWIRKVTNPLTYVTKVSQDANGNVTKIERQANEGATQWQTTNITWDILNHLKTITDPLSRVTTLEYDANENLESIQDAELNTTAYVYDERNLLFKITDANSPAGVTQYDYDTNGNLKKITDAEGNPTQYAFDLFDRIETLTYADNSVEQYTYDKNNNLVEVKTPNLYPQVGLKFDYDALNRLTAKRFPQNPALNAGYSYDLGSRLETANTAAAQNSFTYDAMNRVDIVTQTLNAIAYVLDYDFDKTGNRTKVTYPSGKTVEYTYDGNDRMEYVKTAGINMAQYTYDPLDRRITRDYLTTVTQRAEYTFDIADQLKNLTNKFTAGGNISQFGYPDYDNVGNRLTQQLIQGGNPMQTTNYVYNDIYELETVTGAQTHSYSHDNVGNRNVADGLTYVPNPLNQYDLVGGVTFTYDLNGNLTDDGPNSYTYDEENRLATMQNAQHSAQYEYDAFNRRVSKKVDGLTTYFISDGFREIAEYNASGQLQAEYVYGDYIDEVLAMSRNGKNYYYHYDGLGSVSDLTDDQGNVVERYTYDVYGQPTIFDISHTPLAISQIGNPFLFTGRRFDEESGLYYYRLRMYSPTIGRFLQRDPIGYYDSMNLFEYVWNSPTNWLDPLGLTGEDADELNPKIKGLVLEGISQVIQFAAERLPEGKIRGALKLTSAGFKVASGALFFGISVGSFVAAFGTTPVIGPLPGILSGVGFGILAGKEVSEASKLLREGWEEIFGKKDQSCPLKE